MCSHGCEPAFSVSFGDCPFPLQTGCLHLPISFWIRGIRVRQPSVRPSELIRIFTLSSIPTNPGIADSLPTQNDSTPESELQSEVFIEVVPLRVKVANLIAILLPLAGLIAAAVLLWGWGFSWTHLGLMIGMYLISILG